MEKKQNNGVGFGYRKQPKPGKEATSPIATLFISATELAKVQPSDSGYIQVSLFKTGDKTRATMEQKGKTPTDFSLKLGLAHVDGGSARPVKAVSGGDFDLP